MAQLGRQPAKILFILPNFAGGGAERVTMTLINQLNRGCFAPHLAVLDGQGPLRDLLPEDALLHELNQARLSRAFPALIKLIRRERPAVVFASQGYLNVTLLALRHLLPSGTRFALRESNTPSQSLPNRRFPGAMATAYRCFYPGTDLLFCQHRQTAREMRDNFRVAPEKIVNLVNPVSVEQLRQAAAVPLRGKGGRLRFVAAGRLNRQKGFDRLIPLMVELPVATELTIYGEGPEKAALQRQIRELNLSQRVTLADFTDNLPAALAGADACVISSRWEGLPNVALESLAVGTPVIATSEAGGISELAESASPGAVTVVPWGPAFEVAMATCKAQQGSSLAPSLLPMEYAVEQVAAIFNARLKELAGLGEHSQQISELPEPG